MKTAYVFPGQGSQKVGMGADLAREFAVARQVYEAADDALGYSISRLCFEGPAEELTLTANTQPALLATSIAALRAVDSEYGLQFEIAAGHSLGEWTALVAAGAIDFADAIKLVHLRGKAMQAAVPEGNGGMAALIGLELAAVEQLCAEVAQGQVCAPANLNGAGQVVISGHLGAIDRAVAAAKGKGAKLARKLPVSAPFHCALMQPAADAMADALASVAVSAPAVPVVANFDAQPNSDPARIKDLLVAQVTGAVRWEDSVVVMAEQGVGRVVEIGPGKVLTGLVKRIRSDIDTRNVGDAQQVRQVEE
jgi:[acyl-carrier-protein] S-malonyltransferase